MVNEFIKMPNHNQPIDLSESKNKFTQQFFDKVKMKIKKKNNKNLNFWWRNTISIDFVFFFLHFYCPHHSIGNIFGWFSFSISESNLFSSNKQSIIWFFIFQLHLEHLNNSKSDFFFVFFSIFFIFFFDFSFGINI